MVLALVQEIAGEDPSVTEAKDAEAKDLIVGKLANFLVRDTCDFSSSNEGRHLRRVVLAAVLDGDEIKSRKLLRATARVLDVDAKNRTLTHAMALAARVKEGDIASLFVVEKRAASWNRVPDFAATAAVDFYESRGVSDPTMGEKGQAYRKVRLPNGTVRRLCHAKQYIPADMSPTEFYFAFKKQHPDVTMRQRTFEKFRPWWWRRHTMQDRRTCQCSSHLLPKFAVTAVGEYRRKVNPRISQADPTAHVEVPVFSLTVAADSIMCAKEDTADYHNIECIERTCVVCRDRQAFVVTDSETDRTETQKLRTYRRVPTGRMDKNGDEIKRLEYCEDMLQISELVQKANTLIQPFPAHRFRNFWQEEQRDAYLNNMIHTDPAQGDVYLNLDWAERLTLLMQDEVQSYYWNQKACGILVMVQIRHKHHSDGTDGISSTIEHPVLWKRYVFVYWDDKDQGHQVVHAARIKLMNHDKARGVEWRVLEEWSDQCAEQFCCTGAVYDLWDFVQTGSMVLANKHFSCPGHGKTEGDGAGGQEKTETNHVMVHGGQHFNGGEDVVRYKNNIGRFSLPKASSYDKVKSQRHLDEKLHLYLSPTEVSQVPKRDAKTLSGIKSHDEYEIKRGTGMCISYRKRSCKCEACRERQYELCENKSHVPEWRTHELQPSTARTEYATRSRHEETLELMAQMAVKGDVVAVEHTDREYQHYDYFLVLATKDCYQITVACTDDYGCDYVPGDWVVEGLYLKRTVDTHHLRFKKESSKTAIAHAHSVRRVGVVMEVIDTRLLTEEITDDLPTTELNTIVYQLTVDEHEKTVDAVATHRRI